MPRQRQRASSSSFSSSYLRTLNRGAKEERRDGEGDDKGREGEGRGRKGRGKKRGEERKGKERVGYVSTSKRGVKEGETRGRKDMKKGM